MRYDIVSLKHKNLTFSFEASDLDTAFEESKILLNETLNWELRSEKTPEGKEMPGLLTTHVAESENRGRFYLYEAVDTARGPTHRAYTLTRRKWHTGLGAETRFCIYSIRQEKLLSPHAQQLNKKGKGDEFYCLYPGKYFQLKKYTSNSKSYGYTLQVLRIDEKGTKTLSDIERQEIVPEWLLELLPDAAKRQLFPTPEF